MNEQPIEALRAWLLDLRGRNAALAARLNLPPSVISGWVSCKRPIPLEHCASIERATDGAVTRQDLRPDDWQDIWPELAESKPNNAVALALQAQAATETVAVVAPC